MKRFFIALALAAASFGKIQAQTGIPVYQTLSATGNAAAPSTVYFTAIPNQQVRIVSVSYQADTNNAGLQIQAGSTAYYQTATNATSTSVTNGINSTNGLLAGSTLILDQGGLPYSATLASYGAWPGTNSLGVVTNAYYIVLGANGWNTAANSGSSIYQMSAPATVPVGNTTNSLFSNALYAAPPGRPLTVTLTPALQTNRLNAVSGRYQ